MSPASLSEPSTGQLLEELDGGRRLEDGQFRRLATEESSEVLRACADRTRARFHPDGVVGYVVDRNVNYTNVCTASCTFCAFYRRPGDPEGYVQSFDEIYRRVEETLALGGSGVLMQGGLHPELPLDWYERLLRELKRRYGIYLHCFSPPELLNLSRLSGKPVDEVLCRLKEAGLDSVPGGGAEILVDAFRRRRATKCTGVEWLGVMETAHRLGLPTTATMVIGLGETVDDRLGHLELVRALQDRTGGFVAFIPWTFQPDNTALGRAIPGRVPLEEYLRWLALARLHLDNVRNLQVSWLTAGLEGAGLGLRSGANDLGSVMIEENVISPAGARHRANEAGLRQVIVDAGFVPGVRNAGYRRL
jgi:cyclic dehypoxanthinyl futalosine synthase